MFEDSHFPATVTNREDRVQFVKQDLQDSLTGMVQAIFGNVEVRDMQKNSISSLSLSTMKDKKITL